MPPRHYRGRTNRNIPNRNSSVKTTNTRTPLSAGAKKFFNKFLKQTGFAAAVVLAIYIISVAAPNFWLQISPPIRSALEHNIDFAGIYNDTIERFFPTTDTAPETDEYDDSNNYYNDDYPSESYEYGEYNDFDDDFFIDGYEVFRDRYDYNDLSEYTVYSL